ncbi:Capsular polysaccharide biosynthesis protein [Pseudarthrobacter equi]|uniref:Capsular polysaccharide biosynthesis protein n=1 Tax=Pseudarthrobacter equi TaxID=728066 RepID=A0A1H1SXA4_9MICC|nr:hypothetical protein [Pseudarthrobacter equi]SDS52610.1 Capsular polysaccharide biosynthesis protein [Pseudarthrobacter equi]
MTPVSVLKVLWRHKLAMFTVLVLTLIAGGYVFFFAPRSYMASTVYVLVTPRLPSTEEMRSDPALAALNSDNPYLRSADSSLITQVMATKMSSTDVIDSLKEDGETPDYTVTLPATTGAGQLIRMEATGSSPERAITTAETLGKRLITQLRDAQRVNGADDRYLFTALQIDPPSKATEQFSSRLRSLVVVLIGGVILMFGAVSIARLAENSRASRASGATESPRQARRSQSRPGGHRPASAVHREAPLGPQLAFLPDDDHPSLMVPDTLSYEERGSGVPAQR